MGRVEPEPQQQDEIEDLGERRDYLAEAADAHGDVDLLRVLYTSAQQAGEPQTLLNDIRAFATHAAAKNDADQSE